MSLNPLKKHINLKEDNSNVSKKNISLSSVKFHFIQFFFKK